MNRRSAIRRIGLVSLGLITGDAALEELARITHVRKSFPSTWPTPVTATEILVRLNDGNNLNLFRDELTRMYEKWLEMRLTEMGRDRRLLDRIAVSTPAKAGRRLTFPVHLEAS